MRVRLRKDGDGAWWVESKSWFDFLWGWEHVICCEGAAAYDQAYCHAMALKHPIIEEIE